MDISWKLGMENRGIDPRTSRMLSERSTIWASSPDGCLASQVGGILPLLVIFIISYHTFSLATRSIPVCLATKTSISKWIKENSFPCGWHCKKIQLENRGIDPRASRMRIERSTIWASSPCHAWNFTSSVSTNAFCPQGFPPSPYVNIRIASK